MALNPITHNTKGIFRFSDYISLIPDFLKAEDDVVILLQVLSDYINNAYRNTKIVKKFKFKLLALESSIIVTTKKLQQLADIFSHAESRDLPVLFFAKPEDSVSQDPFRESDVESFDTFGGSTPRAIEFKPSQISKVYSRKIKEAGTSLYYEVFFTATIEAIENVKSVFEIDVKNDGDITDNYVVNYYNENLINPDLTEYHIKFDGDQIKTIVDYDAEKQKLTLNSEWGNIPDSTSSFIIKKEGKVSGFTSTTVILENPLISADFSTADDFYNGYRIDIVDGEGIGQTRTIIDYTGSTRVAVVSTWTTNPNGSSFLLVALEANVKTAGPNSVIINDNAGSVDNDKYNGFDIRITNGKGTRYEGFGAEDNSLFYFEDLCLSLNETFWKISNIDNLDDDIESISNKYVAQEDTDLGFANSIDEHKNIIEYSATLDITIGDPSIATAFTVANLNTALTIGETSHNTISVVRLATTANITLSAPQTIDGVSAIAGDRVLVKNQTLPAQNGVYVVAAGAWTRSTDFNISAEFNDGEHVKVSIGTTNVNTMWELNITDTPFILLTHNVAFTSINVSDLIPSTYTIGLMVNSGDVYLLVFEGSNLIYKSEPNDTLDPNYLDITTAINAGTVRLKIKMENNSINIYLDIEPEVIFTISKPLTQTKFGFLLSNISGNEGSIDNIILIGKNDNNRGLFYVRDLTSVDKNEAYFDQALGDNKYIDPIFKENDLFYSKIENDLNKTLVKIPYNPYSMVRLATTANITLSAPQTIDGVSAIAGDRVLVKNQTLPAQNGVYVVAAGAWTRSADFDTASEFENNEQIYVSLGTINGATKWQLNVPDPFALNTTPITFTNTISETLELGDFISRKDNLGNRINTTSARIRDIIVEDGINFLVLYNVKGDWISVLDSADGVPFVGFAKFVNGEEVLPLTIDSGYITDSSLWEVDVGYDAAIHYVTYKNIKYKVLETHVSSLNEPPDRTPSKFQKYMFNEKSTIKKSLIVYDKKISLNPYMWGMFRARHLEIDQEPNVDDNKFSELCHDLYVQEAEESGIKFRQKQRDWLFNPRVADPQQLNRNGWMEITKAFDDDIVDSGLTLQDNTILFTKQNLFDITDNNPETLSTDEWYKFTLNTIEWQKYTSYTESTFSLTQDVDTGDEYFIDVDVPDLNDEQTIILDSSDFAVNDIDNILLLATAIPSLSVGNKVFLSSDVILPDGTKPLTPYFITEYFPERINTAQTGGSSTITLDLGASAVTDIYNDLLIRIVDGTGIDQVKTIIGYDGSTKIATVNSIWSTIPDSSSKFEILSNNNITIERSDTAQAGGTNTITLDLGASAVNNLYNGLIIHIVDFTGVGQVKTIINYVGATKVATVDSDWSTIPNATSEFVISTAIKIKISRTFGGSSIDFTSEGSGVRTITRKLDLKDGDVVELTGQSSTEEDGKYRVINNGNWLKLDKRIVLRVRDITVDYETVGEIGLSDDPIKYTVFTDTQKNNFISINPYAFEVRNGFINNFKFLLENIDGIDTTLPLQLQYDPRFDANTVADTTDMSKDFTGVPDMGYPLVEKIERLAYQKDPDVIDFELIGYLARFLGYDITPIQDDIIQSNVYKTDDEREKALRSVIHNLPQYYTLKSVKSGLEAILLTFGIVGEVIKLWTHQNAPYEDFIQEPDITNYMYTQRENGVKINLIPTPHFMLKINIDSNIDNDINNLELNRVINSVVGFKPINTVFDGIILHLEKTLKQRISLSPMFATLSIASNIGYDMDFSELLDNGCGF